MAYSCVSPDRAIRVLWLCCKMFQSDKINKYENMSLNEIMLFKYNTFFFFHGPKIATLPTMPHFLKAHSNFAKCDLFLWQHTGEVVFIVDSQQDEPRVWFPACACLCWSIFLPLSKHTRNVLVSWYPSDMFCVFVE